VTNSGTVPPPPEAGGSAKLSAPASAGTSAPAARPRVVVYGNVPRHIRFLDRVRYPKSDEVAAYGWVAQALRGVAMHREGVVVYGKKGVGKSHGLARAVKEFGERQQLLRKNDHAHAIVKVRKFRSAKPKDALEFVHVLYKEEFGEIPPWLRYRGEARALADLIGVYAEDNVGILAFDEADTFPASVLDVARSIIVQTASDEPLSEEQLADEDEPRIGTGILLVGTPELWDRVRQSADWGERWRKAYEINGITHEVLANLYANVLPGFRAEADRIGDEAWKHFIRTDVAPYIKKSLRRVESHVDQYLIAYVDNSLTPVTSISEVAFDDVLFMSELKGLAGSEAPDHE